MFSNYLPSWGIVFQTFIITIQNHSNPEIIRDYKKFINFWSRFGATFTVNGTELSLGDASVVFQKL